MTMTISEQGINLIKYYEGCYLTAYKCPAGVWTIGYGTTEPINGQPIKAGMKITQQQAEDLLRKNLKTYEKAVRDYVKVPLNQNQFDALVSFTYNCGAGNLKTSTLLSKLNKGDYKGAADEFPRWKYANGQVLNGLVKRRESERKLFLAPMTAAPTKPVSTPTKKEDAELTKALNKIVDTGITLDVNAWNHVDNMNSKNVPALLNKLGIMALAEIGVISNPDTWLNSNFTNQDVKCLIIKYANALEVAA